MLRIIYHGDKNLNGHLRFNVIDMDLYMVYLRFCILEAFK